MRFNQAFEVLDHLIEVYVAIGSTYERLINEVKVERTRMLLHYLYDKQQENTQFLKDVKLRMPEALLQTWIDEDIEKSIINSSKQLYVNADITTDDLMEHVHDLHSQTINWLNVTVSVIPNNEMHNQLQNISESLNQRYKQLVQAVNRMDDM